MKEILKRLTNTKTLIAVVGGAVIIVQAMGYSIDNEKVKIVVDAICVIGIAVGILNKNGMETTNWNK